MTQREDVTHSPEFTLRYTTAEDEPFLHKWLITPGVSHWFSVDGAQEIEDLVKIWMSFARFKCSLTATYRGEPCGIATLFLMPYTKLVHMSMGYLLVDPSAEHQGIGTALARNLDHLAKTYFRLERMHYELYGENPLISLLVHEGYKVVFKQAHYLKEGDTYLDRVVVEKVFEK